MKLKIQTRSVFGRNLHYPKCPLSMFLASINRRKEGEHPHTFTDATIQGLMSHGFVIEQVPQFGGNENG
jgi:hypothetical protein